MVFEDIQVFYAAELAGDGCAAAAGRDTDIGRLEDVDK